MQSDSPKATVAFAEPSQTRSPATASFSESPQTRTRAPSRTRAFENFAFARVAAQLAFADEESRRGTGARQGPQPAVDAVAAAERLALDDDAGTLGRGVEQRRLLRERLVFYHGDRSRRRRVVLAHDEIARPPVLLVEVERAVRADRFRMNRLVERDEGAGSSQFAGKPPVLRSEMPVGIVVRDAVECDGDASPAPGRPLDGAQDRAVKGIGFEGDVAGRGER